MKEYFVWLAKIVTFFVLILVAVPLLIGAVAAVSSQTGTEASVSGKSVGVIELSGVISGSKDVLKKLYKYIDDDDIVGVVLRVESPGGAVGPSQEIYSAVRKLKEKKPIVASMGAIAASGGLYVSLGASKVFCQPGTLTGSIGVIVQMPNFTKIANKFGFDMITIKSGELKDVGNAFREMQEDERAFLKGTIDVVHDAFIQAVVDGRNLKREDVVKFADGRLIVGSQALDYSLVDGYGDVYDAARAVYELSGTPLADGERPKLQYADDKFEEIKRLLQSVVNLPGLQSNRLSMHYLMQ